MPEKSDLQEVLDAIGDRATLQTCCDRVGLPHSGRSVAVLKDQLCNHANFSLARALSAGMLTINDLNFYIEAAGGNSKRSLADASRELLDVIRNPDVRRDRVDLEDALTKGAHGLASVLARPSRREALLMAWLRNVRPVDRALFYRLARNRPGPGRPITSPDDNGFVSLRNLDEALVAEALDSLDGRSTRESAFEHAIALTHRMSANFRVYVGRTFVRRGDEARGLLQRWGSHRDQKRMTHGIVLAVAHRDQVEDDEALAIGLVKLWEEFGMLCCNNDVLHRTPTKAEDPTHVVYMCVRPL